MSEPELEKKFQKKKLSGIFFRSQIFFVHDFFFEQKIFFERIIFHEKIQKFPEKIAKKSNFLEFSAHVHLLLQNKANVIVAGFPSVET